MKWTMQAAYAGAAVLAFVGLTAYHVATHSRAPQARASTEVFAADPEDATVIARITGKDEITRELVAGRLSLLQAAAGFRDLGLQGPPDGVRDVFATAGSADEAYCRSVIGFVDSRARPGEDDDLTCGLEAELYDRLQNGTLRLPGAGADSTGDRSPRSVWYDLD